MSLFHIALGVLGVGGTASIIAGMFFAPAATKLLLGRALAVVEETAEWLLAHPAYAVALAFGLFGLWCLHAEHKAEAKIPTLMAAVANERQAFLLERKAFATTKDSLDRANGEIADNNARIKAAADELERERAQAAADEARNAQRAKSTDAEIAALQAAATDPKRKPCILSDEAKKALGDL